MRLKLDENLPAELVDDLRASGHDADSVAAEGLTGRSDFEVARAARRAGRVLLTLDKDLADIRRFPPEAYGGIVVFRLSRTGRMHARRAVLEALPRLSSHRRFAGRLFIVTDSSIRVRR